ncbi:LOW QUALITY PROTEIN: NACHT, LRR and PYD domains-containing protein 12-like [Aplochiton taeniatus]
MKQQELADTLEHSPADIFALTCQRPLKTNLKKKYEFAFEGVTKEGGSTLLNQIYTDVYLTEGGSGEVNTKHEVRQIETLCKKPVRPGTPIRVNDIFEAPPGQDKPIRTVLTKGVAGIGKTFATQKFTLDWAEGLANQKIQFTFPILFRELHLLARKTYSLMELLHQFFIETRNVTNFSKYQVIFVLDGLDECRLPLNFQNNEIWTDVTEPTSVDVLLTNLIKGNLLPSARLWITTRPAAANQIPPEYVDLETEVRGFADPQKEEYFIKKFSKKKLASRIISHIKTSRSIHIMCHIPVFCLITSRVLEHMLTDQSGELPKTLTEMYIHFLVFQTKQGKSKYQGRAETDPHWNTESRKIVLSLGKLAFRQLERGNLIFYESDLTECGIDVCASLVSGCSLTEKRCASLVSAVQSNPSHMRALDLSFNQLADTGMKTLSALLEDPLCRLETLGLRKCDMSAQCCEELALALTSSDLRVLDLSNNNLQDSGVNLLSVGLGDPLCKLKTMRLSACQITEKGFSSLASALRSNPSHLRELDLSHNDLGDSGVELLSAELHWATCNLETLRLSGCLVTERGCASLASALRSDPSHLRELDLSYNHPGDSGAKLLSALLDDPHCSLHTLSVDHGGEIRMKPGLRKYACDLTLDPNTANRTINLSEENRKATCTETEQPYPDHPERFVYCPTVLGREGLSGSRCYWEVEMRGGGNIGVTYRGIERGGYTDNSRVGFYDKSWSVECPGNKYSSYHKGKPTCIPVNPSGSTRVGVYLDWPAGTLSFYRVSSDTLTLIHTFHSSFSEPLYPALTLYYDSSMALR